MRVLRAFAVLCLGVALLSLQAAAATVLKVATGEHPPLVSSVPTQSFLTELFSEIGREMGGTFEFEFLPWKRIELAVASREAWGGMPFVSTPEREKKFFFSDVLYERQTRFFYYSPDGKPKDIHFNTLSDLKGYRIGAVRGYYYEKVLEEAGIQAEYVPNEELNWRKLRIGRVDLVIAPEYNGVYLLRTLFPQDADKFFALPGALDRVGTHLIASKEYPDARKLLDSFNAALKTIKENGVYQRVVDKYLAVPKQ